MACQICNDIASLLSSDRDGESKVVLGTIQDAVHKSTCSVHPPLLTDALSLDSFVDVNKLIEAKKSAVHAEIYFDVGNDFLAGSIGWQKLGKEGGRNTVKLVDNQWIDIDRIKSWKDRCKSDHAKQCGASNSVTFDALPPTWLADCVEQRLVRGEAERSYIALSYVWGEAQRFVLTKDMLDGMQRPGALSSQETLPMLPKGIRDVLSLTLALQERYLWIDCLCIAQDDEETKSREILSMARIYNNASMTIVLASALNECTNGLQDISGPRDLGQKTFKLNEEHTIVQRLCMRKDHRTDSWSKRAWTFQEGLFSHRILEFQKETVFWRCQHAEWFEDVDPAEEDDNSVSDRTEVQGLRSHLSYGLPSFRSLGELIRDYMIRDLTYCEDANAAFSSILTTLGSSFKGGFISGLPAVNLDVALLWLPGAPMTLRAGEEYSGSNLPTWSWLAWQGQLETVCWYKGTDHVVMTGQHLSASERILPLVNWSIPDLQGGEPRIIENEWLALRKKYTTEDANPPKGWTRHDFNAYSMDAWDEEDEEYGYGLGIDPDDDMLTLNRPEMEDDEKSLPKRCYTYESSGRMRFWYPIPMPEKDEKTPGPVIVPYICCETRLARLFGAERLPGDWNDHGAIALRDSSGRFAGALRPNHWSPIVARDDPKHRDIHNLTGTRFDLVELSLGYCYEDYWIECPRSEPNIDEWKHRERPRRSDERYEFYNVMWVVWRDGIAYRRGIGRAEKYVWESLTREHISLTLG